MGAADVGSLQRLAVRFPGAVGYADPARRRETDRSLREHVAAELQRLHHRVGSLMEAAREEGEEDMLEDLARLDDRIARTRDAVTSAEYAGAVFLEGGAISDEELGRVCAYDHALLADLDLLSRDVGAIRYETIGNLTLREVEGTLAGIELKVANRRDIFEIGGRG